MDYLPNICTRKAMRSYVKSSLWDISENLRLLVECGVSPYSLRKTRYTVESFAKAFSEQDLSEADGKISTMSFISNKRDNIAKLCEVLLASYTNYMHIDEIEYVSAIWESYFITNSLRPMNYSIPEQYRTDYDSNQYRYGESIYKVYQLKTQFHPCWLRKLLYWVKKKCCSLFQGS
jgi:hypothetical protein